MASKVPAWAPSSDACKVCNPLATHRRHVFPSSASYWYWWTRVCRVAPRRQPCSKKSRMHQRFAQALQMQFLYVPELVDQAFEHVQFHHCRRMARLRSRDAVLSGTCGSADCTGRPVQSVQSEAVLRQAPWFVSFDARVRAALMQHCPIELRGAPLVPLLRSMRVAKPVWRLPARLRASP